jgi:orotate phosphoribosyltransferase
MREELLGLMAARKGHFRFESGHHGDLWLDLDLLFLHPRSLRPFVAALAGRLAGHAVEVVCGPLAGGAFLAQLIAAELGTAFAHAERTAAPRGDSLYSAAYRIPAGLRPALAGKRVAVVDDVINAGSAVRGTVADVRACGGTVVVLGALLVLGTAAAEFAATENIPLESLSHRPSGLWVPADCPLCAAGVPVEDAATGPSSAAEPRCRFG